MAASHRWLLTVGLLASLRSLWSFAPPAIVPAARSTLGSPAPRARPRHLLLAARPADDGGAGAWENGRHIVRRRRPVGNDGDVRGGRDVLLLRECLEERGLQLGDCGADCLRVIAHCVHRAEVADLGLDMPDVERTLRRLCTDILLYSSFASAAGAGGAKPEGAAMVSSLPAPGEWPDDVLLEGCAVVLGIKIVCYKPDETNSGLLETVLRPKTSLSERVSFVAPSLFLPYMACVCAPSLAVSHKHTQTQVFAPGTSGCNAIIHLALSTPLSMGSGEARDSTFFAQVLPARAAPSPGVTGRRAEDGGAERLEGSSRAGGGGRQQVLWVFFDLESTGLDTTADAITQIGATAVFTEFLRGDAAAGGCEGHVEGAAGGGVGAEGAASACWEAGVFNCAVKPHCVVSAGAAEITGVTTDMLENCPPLAVQGAKLNQWLSMLRAAAGPDVPVVVSAHNGDGFDFPLLAVDMRRAGFSMLEWEGVQLWDSLGFFQRLQRRGRAAGGGYASCRLGSLYEERFGEVLVGAHDALTDVRALARLVLAEARAGAAGGGDGGDGLESEIDDTLDDADAVREAGGFPGAGSGPWGDGVDGAGDRKLVTSDERLREVMQDVAVHAREAGRFFARAALS